MSRRIVIVGGVAGGATTAARARRLDEAASIVMFERGPHVSFASCGLPYFVGDVIPNESDLVLMTPARFRERMNIDVRTSTEVVSIDRERRVVLWRNVVSGETGELAYDALLLATGAKPVRPPVPGVDLPGVFGLRTIADSTAIRSWIADKNAKRAVVIGAGPIGLEMAENLVERGLQVDLVEAAPQVYGPIDPEMASLVADHLTAHGVKLHLGTGFTGIGDDLSVRLANGVELPADLVILGIGVRPESELARAAGLPLGPTGGIIVDGAMRTDDPHIWAVGDVVQERCAITGRPMVLALAGPANRQGRIAADTMCGRSSTYDGVYGTGVTGVFGLTVASTGVAFKRLPADLQESAEVVWLHPKDHVGWFPGAETLHMKIVFDRTTGRLLGAQAVGKSGVERRIDVIAAVMSKQGTVADLEELELCYAPQYGAAKDPVNMAGMVANNIVRGDVRPARWQDIPTSGALLVDVREADEYARGHVEGAINAPLSRLRHDVEQLPRDRELWLYCLSGKRSYDAGRALGQLGLNVRTLSGGIETWRQRVGAGL
jgi:NADPH-dependent 2,4-dienoyl-CoA reductase/sulfur reductase-like enzyme/rhodanese-related sulfurtransferase